MKKGHVRDFSGSTNPLQTASPSEFGHEDLLARDHRALLHGRIRVAGDLEGLQSHEQDVKVGHQPMLE